jgi:hypothetical protein
VRYRLPALAATLAALCILSAAPVLAAPGTLDQQQTDASWANAGFGGVTLGQSFTVGLTGGLTGVSINMNPYAPGTSTTATVTIYALSGGLPTGSALASKQLAGVTNGTTEFVFDTPLPVTATTQLAVAWSWTDGDSVTPRGACPNAYTAGEALLNEGSGWETFAAYVSNHELSPQTYCLQDFAFQTWVLVAAQPTASPTAGPTATPPPTSTAASTDGTSRDGGLLLVFAALGIAAAFVTIRRGVSVPR